MRINPASGDLCVEAVTKVPKRILGRDAEKSDLTEYATINNLMLGKGEVTPEISIQTAKATFSIGSLYCQKNLLLAIECA